MAQTGVKNIYLQISPQKIMYEELQLEAAVEKVNSCL